MQFILSNEARNYLARLYENLGDQENLGNIVYNPFFNYIQNVIKYSSGYR